MLFTKPNLTILYYEVKFQIKKLELMKVSSEVIRSEKTFK